MKNYIIVIILLKIIVNQKTKATDGGIFDPNNFVYNTVKYKPKNISEYTPSGRYYSTEPCVTVHDLIAYHYTVIREINRSTNFP